MKTKLPRICLHCGSATPKNRLTCNEACLSAYRASSARKTIAVAKLHSCLNCKVPFYGPRSTCSDTCLSTLRRQKALQTIVTGPRCMCCNKRMSKSLDRKTCSEKCYQQVRRNAFAKSMYGIRSFLKKASKLDRDKSLSRRLQEQRQPVGSLLNAVAFEINP